MSALPSPVLSEPSPGDLEAQIRAAEQRLIAREEGLQRRLEGLGARVREATRPSRLLVPALGVLAAGAALWWALRRLRPALPGAAPSFPAAPQRDAARHEGGELPWASLLGLAWPMLPAPWRARISPTTATTLIGVGLPILQRLFESRPAPAPLATMPQVDLARYAGTWYEIARLPAPFESACSGQPTATYLPRGAGIEVINRCPTAQGLQEARGEARVVPDSGNAKLEVSLWPDWTRWLPFAWAKYWILYVDPAYQVALVGHPSRRFLWILARRPRLTTPQLEALIEFAQQRGFPVDRLKFVPPA
jgi:apolipoprotein D and lipocalin family protein